MDNSLVHGLGLVFYFYVWWISLQLACAAWGSKRAKRQWVALVRTPFMQKIGIRWLSAFLVVAVSLQILLVVTMLGLSAWTGRPITFD